MQSIRGVYTGKEIKPLEAVHVRPNVHVIITFLDDVPDYRPQAQGTHQDRIQPEDTPTQMFLAKCGG